MPDTTAPPLTSWEDCRLHPDQAWAEIERLREREVEHDLLLTWQRKATLKADLLWQKANSQPETMFPGLHKLIEWLLSEIMQLRLTTATQETQLEDLRLAAPMLIEAFKTNARTPDGALFPYPENVTAVRMVRDALAHRTDKVAAGRSLDEAIHKIALQAAEIVTLRTMLKRSHRMLAGMENTIQQLAPDAIVIGEHMIVMGEIERKLKEPMP